MMLSSALAAALATAAGCGGGAVPAPAPDALRSPTPAPSSTSTSTPAPASSSTPRPTPTPAITPTPAPLAVLPSSLTFDATTSAVQNVTITDGTAGPYSASGCTGIATTSVSGTTLTVTATAGGACSLNVTDSAHNTAPIAITVTTVSVPIE